MEASPLGRIVRGIDYSPGLNATTVSSPVRKSFILTTLLGFWDFRNRGLQRDILTVTMGARNAIDRYLVLRAGIVSHRPQSSSASRRTAGERADVQ